MKFLGLAPLLLLMFFAVQVEAATLYIDPGVATLNRGDAITAAVRIMPDQGASECINAVDAVITYTDNIQPVDVSIGKSILNVWLEQPVINKEERTITFAGGIPNGYCGRVDGDPRLTNILAEIVFRSPGMMVGGSDDSEVKIEFTPETQALLNDGLGTRAPLITLPATFTLSKDPGSELRDDWRLSVQDDDFPPEEFSIELVRDDITYSGKNYIVFSTTDKQTGISHYEVMEEPVLQFSAFKWGGTGVPWIEVNSTQYVLEDQTLNSIIRVKAIDKAGNEYVATYIPDESKQALSQNELFTYIFGAASLFIALGLLIGLGLYLRRRSKKKLEAVVGDEVGSDEDEDANS
jgi:hypothetical protein